MNLALNHPTQKLLFFVAQDITDTIRNDVRRFVERLAASREWVVRPPKIVDALDNSENSDIGGPVETIGGFLEIYFALPPARLSHDIDRQHLEEVTALVEALGDFSREESLAFEFELDGKFVGALEDGEADRTLSEGLLGEWKRHLGITG